MDRHKNTYLGNTFSDSEQELEKKLLYSWHRFVHEDDESQRDDIDRIKKRIDAFIDIYEKEHVHSASRWLIWGKVAAVLTPLLVIGIVAMLLVPLKPDLNEEQYLSVITAENERATVILPDGTDVVLNSDTRLSYNPGFTKDSIRSVSLVGEAYFNVAKDTVRPLSYLWMISAYGFWAHRSMSGIFPTNPMSRLLLRKARSSLAHMASI